VIEIDSLAQCDRVSLMKDINIWDRVNINGTEGLVVGLSLDKGTGSVSAAYVQLGTVHKLDRQATCIRVPVSDLR